MKGCKKCGPLLHCICEEPEIETTGSNSALSAGLSCSFCAKKQKQVRQLIVGPAHEITGYIPYICNECVMTCADILSDEIKAFVRCQKELIEIAK
jgi:hypothetical protein